MAPAASDLFFEVVTVYPEKKKLVRATYLEQSKTSVIIREYVRKGLRNHELVFAPRAPQLHDNELDMRKFLHPSVLSALMCWPLGKFEGNLVITEAAAKDIKDMSAAVPAPGVIPDDLPIVAICDDMALVTEEGALHAAGRAVTLMLELGARADSDRRVPFMDCALPNYAVQVLARHEIVQCETDEFGELQLCVNASSCALSDGRVASGPPTNVMRLRCSSSLGDAHKLELVLELVAEGWRACAGKHSYNEHVRDFAKDMFMRRKLYFQALLSFADIKLRHGDRVLSHLPHNYYRALLEAEDLAQLARLTDDDLRALTSAQFEALRQGKPLAAAAVAALPAIADGDADSGGEARSPHPTVWRSKAVPKSLKHKSTPSLFLWTCVKNTSPQKGGGLWTCVLSFLGPFCSTKRLGGETPRR